MKQTVLCRVFIKLTILSGILCLLLLSGCLLNPEDTGMLVPPTVDQDTDLRSIPIDVAGHTRDIHYQTFGNPDDPPLLIMPGSLSDMRPYLSLQELQNEYFVVIWEQRGNGLSERVTAYELTYIAMVEEIVAVKQHFSPDRPVTLMGHSWSAVFTALFLGRYPEDVEQAILVEPFGLKSDFMEAVNVPLNLTTSGYLDMMYTSKYLTPQTHEMLDYQMLAVLRSGVRDYFCDIDNLPPWPVWRVGGYALICWEKNLLDGTHYNYDFTAGLSDFPGKVLLVGSECSPIGYDFQHTYHQPLFQNARTARIDHSGHRIITEQYNAFITVLRGFLHQYNSEG